ncbi:response regulator transcription factor [Facklamia sp. DSM 111018]|uniref:Response regulator transcription factor n=1 Tax=Facklamia lactis TaxID=2749967 RepID=A0ABS0LSM0_9LACT|nr:response regulator transcription factor [Facklamia lactis]MBG9981156.1 response regulator transcription factor [Facklamia lactis]MBG9986957.1 response regulator transcription factor [Facklamia lactis]
MTKILLVDDETLIRSGLAILLQSFSELEIIGQASNGKEAFAFCQAQRPDCILMDIRMPEMNGIEATQRIHELDPSIKILILTTFQDSEYISQALQYGASGYLLKDSSHQEIAEAISTLMQGNMVFDGKISHHLVLQKSLSQSFKPQNYQLKEKEVEIIRLVASGLNNQEIADQLYLSLGTVKNNVSLILDKLELRDRTQLAIFAFEKGIK